jgi:hypothetical protein
MPSRKRIRKSNHLRLLGLQKNAAKHSHSRFLGGSNSHAVSPARISDTIPRVLGIDPVVNHEGDMKGEAAQNATLLQIGGGRNAEASLVRTTILLVVKGRRNDGDEETIGLVIATGVIGVMSSQVVAMIIEAAPVLSETMRIADAQKSDERIEVEMMSMIVVAITQKTNQIEISGARRTPVQREIANHRLSLRGSTTRMWSLNEN